MPTMTNILDADFVKEYLDDYKTLKIRLKKTKKGTSLVARKAIKNGETIALYKFKVYDIETHHSFKHYSYAFTVYRRDGKTNHKLIGDITSKSLEQSKDGISYLAYFSNEPSTKQHPNATIDTNLEENYSDRKTVKAGDFLTYKLVATRNIKPNEEIMWCYGDAYHREYKISRDCDE